MFNLNKKSTWSRNIFYRYYILKNLAIRLAKNILGNNSRTKILPDIGFAMESQESKDLSFCIDFRKKRWQHFQKNAKYHISGTFLLKFGENWIFHKNLAPSLFSNYIPLTSCKKSQKTNGPILGELLINGWTNERTQKTPVKL